MTPQNQSLPTRVLAPGSRSRRALQLGLAGVVALSASVAVPAALAQTAVDPGPAAASVTSTVLVPPTAAPTTAAPTTVAPTTTAPEPVAVAPVEVAPAAVEPPAPTAEELTLGQLAAFTPEQKAAFEIMAMTPAQRDAFVAFISPPPPPPPPPAPVVVEEPVADAAPVAEAPAVENGEAWDRLAQCEANGNWHINTGNGYSGGLQFHPGTWNAMGGGQYAPYAYQASREQQIDIAEKVRAAAGGRFSPWPGCRAKLGLP